MLLKKRVDEGVVLSSFDGFVGELGGVAKGEGESKGVQKFRCNFLGGKKGKTRPVKKAFLT